VAQYCTSVVGLYSNALFNYLVKSNLLESASKEVVEFSKFLDNNELLVKNLSAPIYSETERTKLLKNLSQVLNLSPALSNLLFLLAKNERLALLPKIFTDFARKVDEHNGYKNIVVTVACKLSNSEQKIIEEKLEEFFKTKVHIDFKIDPEIVGGLVIKIDDKMYDSSIKSKFALLTRAVKNKLALISNGV